MQRKTSKPKKAAAEKIAPQPLSTLPQWEQDAVKMLMRHSKEHVINHTHTVSEGRIHKLAEMYQEQISAARGKVQAAKSRKMPVEAVVRALISYGKTGVTLHHQNYAFIGTSLGVSEAYITIIRRIMDGLIATPNESDEAIAARLYRKNKPVHQGSVKSVRAELFKK